MGYQESLIRVNSLAEIAGIEKAINESEEVKTLEYLVCLCGAKAKHDLYRDPLTTSKPMKGRSQGRESYLPLSQAQGYINLFSGSTASQEYPTRDTRNS